MTAIFFSFSQALASRAAVIPLCLFLHPTRVKLETSSSRHDEVLVLNW